ncbi:MAG: VWA domain-containing protein [Pyrinomonadaceae bacterium]|nr:VWA domain-containing protein [Pyrinomonadaceae bacterium]
MKRTLLAATFAIALATAAVAQNDTTTRPRVATTPSAPTIANDSYPDRQPSGPPVLAGRGTHQTPAPTPPPADDDEIIRVETNLVTMPVSVLDRDGRFISGLQQRDFRIFENGVEQKIDYFQSVEQPFTVILMIDVSPSTEFKIDEIQNAANTFVNQLRPSDRVMVIAFDQDVHVLCPPTTNRNQMRNAIYSTQFGNGTSLYEAVDDVIRQQLSRIEGRKAVVLFSDGVDTTSRRAGYDDTLRATEEVDALFYTIRYDTSAEMGVGSGGGGYPPPRGGRVTLGDILAQIILGGTMNTGGGRGGVNQGDYAKGKAYLETLATNSGGRPFEAKSIYNVDAAFSGIAEELRRQYSLGYYPEAVGTVGERRQIKIRVMRPSVVVRAKTSYIVGQQDRKFAGS